jgi:23S rRNA C2498 (ribose-2'-O)-methylase RlmM
MHATQYKKTFKVKSLLHPYTSTVLLLYLLDHFIIEMTLHEHGLASFCRNERFTFSPTPRYVNKV